MFDGWFEGGFEQQRDDSGGYPRQSEKDGKELRALMHMSVIEFHSAIVARFLCCFGQPSLTLMAITWRGVGCRWGKL